jgi:hypothetical protein
MISRSTRKKYPDNKDKSTITDRIAFIFMNKKKPYFTADGNIIIFYRRKDAEQLLMDLELGDNIRVVKIDLSICHV